jgi:hypothetical protein
MYNENMKLLVFFIVVLFVSNPALADCTLSGTAVCNGNSCANETRPEGHVIYNTDFKAHQTCLNNEWIAVGGIGCADGSGCHPCTGAAPPSIGETCTDGSVHAGLSPDGNVPMYTTPADAPSLYSWNDGTANWTNMPLEDCRAPTPGPPVTCQTGETNTAFLVGAIGEPDYPFAAAEYCDGLSAHGYDDWYLPAQDEVNVLFTNKNTGDLNGTFDESGSLPAGVYVSSSERDTNAVRGQLFSDGTQNGHLKSNSFSVRCVRKGA